MGENELYHYGVLGMKWGVRKDRTRGGFGKKKKKTKLVLESPFSQKKRQAEERTKAQESADAAKGVKKISDMSDDELRSLINRMQLERQYKDLLPKQKAKGKSWAKQFLAKNAEYVLTQAVQRTADRAIKKALDKKFGKDSSDGKKKSKEGND